MSNGQARIQAIYRYPVKGLSPELMTKADLAVGATIPGDRIYAIENGPTGFDPAAPTYFPKQRFLMLMRNECLAALNTSYDAASHTLTIHWKAREVARGDLCTPAGRLAIEAFFRRFMPRELHGPPKVLFGDGHSFSDVAKKVVSIINLASIADLETMLGVRANPLRFRANLYLAGWPAWRELDLVGTTLAAGSAQLRVVKRITRCAATNVDPDTGIRDLAIPPTLMQRFGHMDCGIYAEVIGAGRVEVGDSAARAEL